MKCLVFDLTLVEGIEDNDLWGQYGSGELYEQICGAWNLGTGRWPGCGRSEINPYSGRSFYFWVYSNDCI